MIIPNKKELTDGEYNQLQEIAAEFNCKVSKIKGETVTLYPIIGDENSQLMINRLEGLPFVDHVQRLQVPYKIMAKGNKTAPAFVKVGGVKVGDGNFRITAGHCTIDPNNRSLFLESAHAIKEAGADFLRGGVWKPRTNPHTFQGDDDSLHILIEAKEQTGLPVVTEVMDDEQLEQAMEAGVDMLQIGARNALNYGLLKKIAKAIHGKSTAVILKRSMHMGPVEEFISAAEYLAASGNMNILMCPRGTSPGVSGFRNSPDSSITLLLKKNTWAPVMVDPSHSVGNGNYVPNEALAAAAYGADGAIIETHVDPKRGIGDDPKQAITPDILAKVIKNCKQVYEISKDLRK